MSTELDRAVSKQTKNKEFTDVNEVSLNLGSLLNDKRTSDIKILTADEGEVYVHSLILRMRSPNFKETLKPGQTTTIDMKEHSYNTVLEFCRFLYSGLPNLTDDNWKLVLPLADEHRVDRLKDLCFGQMIKKVKVDSVCSLILLARSGKEKYYDDIFVQRCVSLIAKRPNDVMETKDFFKLDAQTIKFILMNEELNIEELQLFEHVLRWGRSQLKPGQDLKDILTEDIMQLIRYPLIGVKDLYEIVKPTNLCPEKEWIEALELLVCGDELPKKYAQRGAGNSTYLWSNGTKEFQINSTSWQMIMGTELKEKTKHQWNIKLKSFTQTGNSWAMIIGVAKKTHGMTTYLGATADGWGYVANGKKNHNSGSGANYSETFGSGDTITVILDLSKGELSFKKNGKNLGVAFTNVTGPVCLACSVSANVHAQLTYNE